MVTASALEIRETTVDHLLREGQILFREHWREVGENRDARQLKLDELRYLALEQSGNLLLLAAYDDESIVGYSVALLAGPHIHDLDMAPCSSDALFVTKPYRGYGIGGRLMRETERLGKEVGCTCMLWHAMKGSELDLRLEASHRYTAQDVIYTRTL